jgi:hypothetical protein
MAALKPALLHDELVHRWHQYTNGHAAAVRLPLQNLYHKYTHIKSDARAVAALSLDDDPLKTFLELCSPSYDEALKRCLGMSEAMMHDVPVAFLRDLFWNGAKHIPSNLNEAERNAVYAMVKSGILTIVGADPSERNWETSALTFLAPIAKFALSHYLGYGYGYGCGCGVSGGAPTTKYTSRDLKEMGIDAFLADVFRFMAGTGVLGCTDDDRRSEAQMQQAFYFSLVGKVASQVRIIPNLRIVCEESRLRYVHASMSGGPSGLLISLGYN